MKARRAIRCNPGLSVGVGVGLVLFALVLVVGLRGESTRTLYFRTPCAAAPASKECQYSKIQVERQQSVRTACIGPRKGNLPCPLTDAQRDRLNRIIGPGSSEIAR